MTLTLVRPTLIPNEPAIEHLGNVLAMLLMGERTGEGVHYDVATVERMVERLWRARQQLAGEDFTEPPISIGVRT